MSILSPSGRRTPYSSASTVFFQYLEPSVRRKHHRPHSDQMRLSLVFLFTDDPNIEIILYGKI